MPFAFERLLVYQKAPAFADAVCSLTRTFPRGCFFLADQFNRAALSIAANIAEGNGRFRKADRRNSIGLARGRNVVRLSSFHTDTYDDILSGHGSNIAGGATRLV